jgi:YidC/Oxa1 family membrane protein insertase
MGPGAADEPASHTGNVDWGGAHTRYFVAALLPDNPREASARFTPTQPGKLATLELGFARAELPPGGRLDREYRLYLGPKEPDRLDAMGAHLDEAIQKGWFPSLTRFFTWLLTATHNVVPNYGVAIILITIVVRLLMAPLMARQMKSMKRMSVLQPRMKEIQEKYPDDRQKQSEAMMALYREAGVNPLSMMTGCLPMFLQLPVFIGFYYALQGAIQLRQQPFVAWIDDLSMPEALFVIPGIELPVRLLPILMGASMVLQQKLTPTTMDPAQARVMLTVMPVMFTVMFYQFASGLVLYWFVSTLLGIGQQVLTNRGKT